MATVQNFEKSFQAPSTPEDAYCSGAVESTLKFIQSFTYRQYSLNTNTEVASFFKYIQLSH